MLIWLLSASEVIALAAMDLVPARMRSRVILTPKDLLRARPGESVHLVLPEGGLLQHRIALPDHPHRANHTWLFARIDALSPWEQDAFLWGTKLGPDHLDLAILSLARITEAEQVLTQRGARLAEVSAGGFWFRRDATQLRRWRDRLALTVGLVCVLGLGVAVVGVQAFWQANERAEVSLSALNKSAARLKEGAGPAQAALALLQLKSGGFGLALSHLAQSLPQESYLTTLSATPRGIDISGKTLTPEGIIPALSVDPVFATVNFAGPAAHDAVSGSYTFAIHVTMGELP